MNDNNKNNYSYNHNSTKTCIPLVVSGGTLETSAGWRQLLADMLGCPVVLNKSSDIELTTLGVLRHIEYIRYCKTQAAAFSSADRLSVGGHIDTPRRRERNHGNRLIVRDLCLPRNIVTLQDFLGKYYERSSFYYEKLSD